MSDKNKRLFKEAERAINDLYVDTSVDIHTALANLQELKNEIKFKMEALREDIKYD